jgi:hypothetical protein
MLRPAWCPVGGTEGNPGMTIPATGVSRPDRDIRNSMDTGSPLLPILALDRVEALPLNLSARVPLFVQKANES